MTSWSNRSYTAGTGTARRLRVNATDAERLLWRGLREALPQVKFRRQVPIGPYVVDFCAHAARLIVEVDGGQHADNARDAERTAYLEAAGYRVLRFWNNEVLTNLTSVLQSVASAHQPLSRKEEGP